MQKAQTSGWNQCFLVPWTHLKRDKNKLAQWSAVKARNDAAEHLGVLSVTWETSQCPLWHHKKMVSRSEFFSKVCKIHKRWTLRNVCCHARDNNNDILIMCLLIVFYYCFFTNFSDEADHVKHETPSTWAHDCLIKLPFGRISRGVNV